MLVLLCEGHEFLWLRLAQPRAFEVKHERVLDSREREMQICHIGLLDIQGLVQRAIQRSLVSLLHRLLQKVFIAYAERSEQILRVDKRYVGRLKLAAFLLVQTARNKIPLRLRVFQLDSRLHQRRACVRLRVS